MDGNRLSFYGNARCIYGKAARFSGNTTKTSVNDWRIDGSLQRMDGRFSARYARLRKTLKNKNGLRKTIKEGVTPNENSALGFTPAKSN
jgi:hypothetical protein